MKKNIILLMLGMFIFLSATVVADNISNVSDNVIVEARQHPNKDGVWQIVKSKSLFEKAQIKEFTFQNKVNLKEWGFTKKEVIEIAASSSEQLIELKINKKETVRARSLFDFYQPVQKLVVEKINETCSVKVITEQEDVKIGIFFAIWVVLLLILTSVLVSGFKLKDDNLISIPPSIMSISSIVSIAIVVIIAPSTVVIATFAIITIVVAVIFSAIVLDIATDQNKKRMLIASFFYYLLSLLLFYAVSDEQHVLIPVVAVPLVFAITWRLVKYKD